MKVLCKEVYVVLLMGILALGCSGSVDPIKEITPDQELAQFEASHVTPDPGAPPLELITVELEIEALKSVFEPLPAGTDKPTAPRGPETQGMVFWPYTGTDFTGTPQDPINLVFMGNADPRALRSALMSLDGDRSGLGLPPVPPFNSVWEDAIGDVQTGYGKPGGWTGSVVQLQCGGYSEPRFHIRLFKIGSWTIANAHFEVLIPGTTDHQVLSWELAEQFIVGDFVRSGLLDPRSSTELSDQINLSPFKSIPAVIYNGLPVELRALIGGPLGDVTEDVPISSDGRATILDVAGRVPYQAATYVQDFVIDFGQVIPKPFCSSGPDDFVYVTGPVHLEQTVQTMEHGEFEMSFEARGELSVTPVNPSTGEPIGPTLPAFVCERHASQMTNSQRTASSLRFQRIGSEGVAGSGLLFVRLCVGPHGNCGYEAIVRCDGEDQLPAAPSVSMTP